MTALLLALSSGGDLTWPDVVALVVFLIFAAFVIWWIA